MPAGSMKLPNLFFPPFCSVGFSNFFAVNASFYWHQLKKKDSMDNFMDEEISSSPMQVSTNKRRTKIEEPSNTQGNKKVKNEDMDEDEEFQQWARPPVELDPKKDTIGLE